MPRTQIRQNSGYARLLAMRAAAFPQTDGGAAEDDHLDLLARQFLIELGPRDAAGQRGEPQAEDVEGRALASFRLLELPNGAALGQSYAARFYDLSPMAVLTEPLVELGRFCLAPNLAPAQAADVLRLAWGAITAAVDAAGAVALLGCSSFAKAAPERHLPALRLLAARHLGPEALRPMRRAAEVVDLASLAQVMPLTADARRAGLAGLPPLLRSYLGMGAWVSDHAVVDRALNTLHVLTFVAVDAVPEARAASLRALSRMQAGA